MHHILVKELAESAFAPFGTYFNPADSGPALMGEAGPVRFYPDRLLCLFENSNYVALSQLALEPRALNITATEIHAHTEEVFGGFTRDVLFHVGPAGNTTPDLSRFKVFHLPAGWWARIKRNVWHHAPFVIGAETTMGIVLLPPATYTNDCYVVELGEAVAIDQ